MAAQAKPRIRVGTDGTLRGFAPAVPVPARPTSGAAYMRGGRDNLFQSWMPPLRDAREDVRQAYWLSAARAIELMHNSGWLAGLVQQAKASILGGDGLQVVPKPDWKALGWTQKFTDEWVDNRKRRFNGWAKNPLECDAAGKQTLHAQVRGGLGSFFGPGEIVQLMRWIERPQSQTSTKVQMVPAHRLTQESNGIDLFQGIRIDANGMPLAFRMQLPSPLLETGTVVEIPARDRANRPRVVHIFDGDIGQMRGLSPFTPVLRRLREFDLLTGATLSTELARAIIAATITSEKETEEVLQAFQDPNETGANGSPMEHLMEMRADWYDNTSFDLAGLAKIVHLFPGEKLDLKTGGDSASAYDPLADRLLREVAVCSGHTVEEMTGDYSSSGSYSAIRMSTTTRWPIIMHRRNHIAAPCYQAAYDCLLEEDIDAGRDPFPGGIVAFLANRDAACNAMWRGPPKPQPDDKKFADATKVLKSIGVLTDEQICGDLGFDWEDVYRQLAEEKKLRQELGLPELVIAGTTVVNEDELDEEETGGDKAGDKAGGKKV